MRYIIRSKVVDLKLKRRALIAWADNTDPANPKVEYEYETIGWFVTFENSHESLFLGKDKPPDMEPGTEVEIVITPKP